MYGCVSTSAMHTEIVFTMLAMFNSGGLSVTIDLVCD